MNNTVLCCHTSQTMHLPLVFLSHLSSLLLLTKSYRGTTLTSVLTTVIFKWLLRLQSQLLLQSQYWINMKRIDVHWYSYTKLAKTLSDYHIATQAPKIEDGRLHWGGAWIVHRRTLTAKSGQNFIWWRKECMQNFSPSYYRGDQSGRFSAGKCTTSLCVLQTHLEESDVPNRFSWRFFFISYIS